MKRALIIIGVILMLFVSGSLFAYQFFYSMETLPEGHLIETHPSPDHHYRLNIYLVNSHSTVAPAIRGELIAVESGKVRNIYWEYRVERAQIKWQPPNEVIINGHLISLDKGYYDFRHDD